MVAIMLPYVVEPESDTAVCCGCVKTSARMDTWLATFGALAAISGSAVYQSPLFDPGLRDDFRSSFDWRLVTNTANIAALLGIIPGPLLDRFGTRTHATCAICA